MWTFPQRVEMGDGTVRLDDKIPEPRAARPTVRHPCVNVMPLAGGAPTTWRELVQDRRLLYCEVLFPGLGAVPEALRPAAESARGGATISTK